MAMFNLRKNLYNANKARIAFLGGNKGRIQGGWYIEYFGKTVDVFGRQEVGC